MSIIHRARWEKVIKHSAWGLSRYLQSRAGASRSDPDEVGGQMGFFVIGGIPRFSNEKMAMYFYTAITLDTFKSVNIYF